MPNSSPMRAPTRRAISAHSSMVTPATGTKGTTSVAPIRGCSPCVAGHVDDLGRPLHGLKGRLLHRFGGAYEGDDRPVGLLPGIHVQEADVGHRLDGVGDLLDDGGVPALRDIRNAFDDGVHACRPPGP